MSARARLTPYELAFPPDLFGDEVFPSIKAEAESRGVSTARAERFLMLATVGNQLHELQPEQGPTAVTAGLPAARAVGQYGALLFQSFRFWDTGCRFLTLDELALRAIASSDSTAADWRFGAPHPAGYVQFPRHLLWGRIDESAPAEAIDGLYWSADDGVAAPPGRLDLLLVLGMHPARPGFSVVEAAAPLPPPPPGHWADIQARSDGADFRNILPGGDLRDLLALTSVPEVLKFVSRLFHYIDQRPECVDPPAAADPGTPDSPHEVRPSALAASRVRLCN